MIAGFCILIALICWVFAAFIKQPIDDLAIEWVGAVFFALSFLVTDDMIARVRR